MSKLRAGIILWRSGVLVLVVGAGLATALMWRPGLPWPGSMPIEDAAAIQYIPKDLLLERCSDSSADFFAEPEVKAALLVATQTEAVRLEATVWDAWGAPWQMQMYDRNGQTYVGRVEIINWDTYSVPPEGPGASDSRPAPQIRLAETPLSAETTLKFEEEWRRSVTSATDALTLGRDGTNYYFRIDGACATAWSPEQGTRSARLTSVLDAVSKGADDSSLGALLDAIEPPAKTIPWPPLPAQAD